MPKKIALIVLVALWSGSADASPGILSHFFLCIARNGEQYMVDAYSSDKCPNGDEAVRCQMPSKEVIHTRGRKACIKKGGLPMEPQPQNSN